jgi:iron complex outermembrane receptor protein
VPVNLAIGAESSARPTPARRATPPYAAGPITDAPPGAQAGPGLRPQDAFDGSRHLSSVYADIESDLSKELLVGAAVRCSDYSDFGSASTGKLSARYKFNEQFLLRGSVSNSFRAPALVQTGFRFSTLNFNSDGSGLQTASLLPASDPLARAFGAQALKPEKSTNLSLGLAWKPARNTSFTLDGYRIKIKDRITRTSDLQSDAATAYLASIGRSDIQSVAYLANLLDTTTSGLDAVLNHDLPRRRQAQPERRAQPQPHQHRQRAPVVGRAGQDRSRPDRADRHQPVPHPQCLAEEQAGAGRRLAGAQWSLLARATRFGPLKDFSYDDEAEVIDGVHAQRFGAVWTLDLEAQYKLSKQLTISVGADNLLDRYPQRVRETNNATYGGALPYNFINPIGVNGAYFYGRLRYTF